MTVAVGCAAVMHQFGVRIVAVVVVWARIGVVRRRRGTMVEVNMVAMVWWMGWWCCGHGGSRDGSLAFW